MVVVSVRSVLGLGSIPNHRASAVEWLKRQGIRIYDVQSKGGRRFDICVSDLPDPERLAYLRRFLDDLGLDQGAYDDAAHADFAQASSTRRARAERKAAIAATLASLRARGVKQADRFALVRERFGEQGTSTPALKRLQTAIKGGDPINYAPALLDDYRPTKARAEISEEAWRFFLTMLRDAAPDWPLKEAWRRVRDAGKALGWRVPSYATFNRRWQAMTETERLTIRLGKGEAAKRLAQPALRDKTSIASLEWVSLDGRTLDFWVDWGDGKAARPVMVALVDVASNLVLDWELAPSENATATVRLIRRVCERFGIFERLYTDNGSAFSGHLVAGGNEFRFRNGKAEGLQPMGICKIMGIELRFALPANAQAKIAERTFATLSRSIDDGPEFKGAHAGHEPGASPSPLVTPVPVETAKAVIASRVKRHNREDGRRSQGANGQSYDAVFRDGIERRARPVRKTTARQLYLASLIWKPAAVDRSGQITVRGWTYGGPETQDTLLRFHGKGQRILIGCDPDDFDAPAMAYDGDGNLICEGILPVKRGAYDSVDGIRQAARNRKIARDKTAEAAAAQNYLDDEDYARAMAALDAPDLEDTPPPAPRKVVGGRFGGPLSVQKRPLKTESNLSDVIEEFDRANGFDPRRILSGQ